MKPTRDRLVVSAAAILLLGVSATGLAQSTPVGALDPSLAFSSNPNGTPGGEVFVTDGPTPDTYGTTSNAYYVATAWDAQPADSSFTYNFANMSGGSMGITRSNTSGSSWVHIPVRLPNGALWTKIETEYCDNGSATLAGFIFRQAKGGDMTTTTFLTSSGTPGCVVETATLASPITVDNDGFSYFVELNMGHLADNSVIFGSMRMGYRLQVSLAPAVATFPNDVPTSHPFFRFVEALAAAGVTGGCGTGRYCPDQAVTRGQMAVFLSVALGLHFPN